MQVNIWTKLYYLYHKVENVLSKKQKETILLVLL